MPDPIDYEECKTQQFGVYVLLAICLLLLLALVFPITMRIESKLDQIQPCTQVNK